MKESLGLTDGNLWGHAQRLVDAKYLEQGRTLTRGGFQVVLRITRKGSEAFKAYLESWQQLLAQDGPTHPVV